MVTDEQYAGKGQRGNTWESEPGQNLTFSMVLKPQFLHARFGHELYVAVSVGILQALQKLKINGLKIKWPNDIFIDNKKVCGILIENILQKTHLEYSIIGVGINVDQTVFSNAKATSLKLHNHKDYDPSELMENVLASIEYSYLMLKNGHYPELKRYYHDYLYWIGEEHTFSSTTTFQGVIQGIDEVGRLMINSNGQTQHYDHKAVSFMS